MGLFKKSGGQSNLEKWVKSASEESLYDEYEKHRVVHFSRDGDGEKSAEMLIIENELTRRDVEKMKQSPYWNPNSKTRWTDANRWEKD